MEDMIMVDGVVRKPTPEEAEEIRKVREESESNQNPPTLSPEEQIAELKAQIANLQQAALNI